MTNKSAVMLTNKGEVLQSLAGMEGDIQAAVMEQLKTAALGVRNKLKDSLPAGAGEPSAPGSAPYSQTGDLKKNIKSKVLPPLLGKPITAVVYMGKDGFYGRMLEFGTSKMAARPWFLPVVYASNPAMRAAILAGLDKEIARRKSMRGTYTRRASAIAGQDIAMVDSL